MRANGLAAVVTGVLVGALAAVGGAGRGHAAAPGDGAAKAPVDVMVLGVFHLDNPGRDLHNARVAPVTTPAKQRELAELARRLAEFRPTVVAVERESDAPGLADPKYPAFTPADLTRDGDERVQIGYRVAALTGARVIAVDVQEKPGEPAYFPYEPVAAWGKAHPAGQAMLDASHAKIAAFTAGVERDQATRSLTRILAEMNGDGPGNQRELHRMFYHGVLALGDRDAQPGAELAGRWFTRNAKIFAKIAQATRPGDRVLVVYGAGHSYWLRELARETPEFRDVPVARLLK